MGNQIITADCRLLGKQCRFTYCIQVGTNKDGRVIEWNSVSLFVRESSQNKLHESEELSSATCDWRIHSSY